MEFSIENIFRAFFHVIAAVVTVQMTWTPTVLVNLSVCLFLHQLPSLFLLQSLFHSLFVLLSDGVNNSCLFFKEPLCSTSCCFLLKHSELVCSIGIKVSSKFLCIHFGHTNTHAHIEKTNATAPSYLLKRLVLLVFTCMFFFLYSHLFRKD